MPDQSVWNQPKAKGLVKVLCILRAIIGDIGVVIATFVYGVTTIFFAVVFRNHKIGDYMAYLWGRDQCLLYNLKVEAFGLENVPQQGVLFLFNHSSDFDIAICHKCIRRPFRFGAKIELYKIPIFGSVLKYSGALPITRGDRDKVLALYRESVPRVHAGQSTRSCTRCR
jgi:1-acyl-sn-glycerol-3-phosphate acyltransferase